MSPPLSTGVSGLDEVLGGGIRPGAMIVLAGAPGTGKTILGQQICFANATLDRHAVYYTTLSEPHTKVVEHLEPFAFYAADSLGPLVEYLHLGELIRQDDAGGLAAVVSEIVRKVALEHPSVVVVDSAKVLRDFAGEHDLRGALYDLTSRLAHFDTALVLIGEYSGPDMDTGIEFALADGTVELAYEFREPIDRRWLRVRKMRGRKHLEGKHTFRIGGRGLEVFPRIETVDLPGPLAISGRIGSGVTGLDPLMGGGISGGEATVLVGPPGVGKTIFCLGFVAEGLARGEECLYITFQDTGDQLARMAAGFGWDFTGAVARGQLTIHHIPLGELDLDLLAAHVRDYLATGSIRRVVIDSLAEMVDAVREAARFPAYARGMIGLIRGAGASVIITSETTTLGPPEDKAGSVMFLFHNLVLLRYIESGSSFTRALSVLKMRRSKHDTRVHELAIGPTGMAVVRPLDDVTGTLGWTALRTQRPAHPE
ncbi:ATPase domain-containing protein [Actinokineospora sp. NBRC 105648]|uniref:ATPase domain-containing protein n=1 Tax=Actinokineospora sp. NBRC 105648 TaxID=3032206 RepID=UPI0024A0D234|nr:ATPase domain-containing protein [Actinokineospora sp. NBRC 105648]GLZ38884.1 circadian clock protein KaiC [Actinokineospora sp. NBRC 105648]